MLMEANPKPELLPGDALLYYHAGSVFDIIIALKIWCEVAHIEIYSGQSMSVASRNGLGVNLYPLRWADLAWVLRPAPCCGELSVERAMHWFRRRAQGQKYDWLGLLCFTLAVKRGDPHRMFCSEFATRWYREGGFRPFSDETDADHVAPAQFLQSPAFTPVWKAK